MKRKRFLSRPFFPTVLSLVLGICMANQVYAATHYAAPAGDASWSSSTNMNTPCSISTAFDNAASGDTVLFRGGTYTGFGGHRFGPGQNGTREHPIVFKNFPGEYPVFDGGGRSGPLAYFDNGGNWVMLDGLEISEYAYGDTGTLWIANGANHISVQNCRFISSGTNKNAHFIYTSVGQPSEIVIRNNYFRRLAGTSHGTTLHCYHATTVQGLEFYNNLVVNGRGYVIASGANDVKIYNNVFYNTYDQDVWEVTQVVIKNNIYMNSGMSEYYPGSYITGNNLYQNTINMNPGPHDIEANPLLVDPATGDLCLRGSSRALDAGETLSEVLLEHECNGRRQGVLAR